MCVCVEGGGGGGQGEEGQGSEGVRGCLRKWIEVCGVE